MEDEDWDRCSDCSDNLEYFHNLGQKHAKTDSWQLPHFLQQDNLTKWGCENHYYNIGYFATRGQIDKNHGTHDPPYAFIFGQSIRDAYEDAWEQAEERDYSEPDAEEETHEHEDDSDVEDYEGDDDDVEEYEEAENNDGDDASDYYQAEAVEDPPEVKAAERFASAQTREQLDAVTQDFSATLSQEAIERIQAPHLDRVETQRVESLLVKIEGKTAAVLHQRYMADLAAMSLADFKAEKHRSVESLQLHDLATKRDLIAAEQQIAVLRIFVDKYDTSWAVLAKRRIREIEEEDARRETLRQQEKEQKDAATVAYLRTAAPEILAAYVDNNNRSDVAVKALAHVTDKLFLRRLYLNNLSTPAGRAAKRRYYEILDDEAAHRSFIERLRYTFNHPYERDL